MSYQSADTPQSENRTIEGDRDIPSIAHNKDYSKLGITAFILVGVIAIIFVALEGMKKNEPPSLIAQDESTFKAIAPPNMQAPYIEDVPEIEAKIAAETAQSGPSDLEIQMMQEALKQAKEAETEMKRRIASPQIVFDKQSAIPAATSVGGEVPSSSLYTGNDPNLAFAHGYANTNAETARASQMHNLHALIPQGTMIDGILETAIQSDLPGMVRAIVSENTYSFDGTALLIPKGSRLIGRYNSGVVRGQSRVFIIWNRVMRPDGVSINIGSTGADDLGRSGLGGEVDTHFFERFGSSVLLSLIDGGIQAGVNTIDNNDAQRITLNTGNSFSRAAEIALDNSIAIKPTIHVHQGSKIKVFVSKDLDFSAVE